MVSRSLRDCNSKATLTLSHHLLAASMTTSMTATATATVAETSFVASKKMVEVPGFLYNLLTSADARSVQRRSAFYSELSDDEMMNLDEDFIRRSNSLTLKLGGQQSVTSKKFMEARPSSMPHHLYRPHLHSFSNALQPHSQKNLATSSSFSSVKVVGTASSKRPEPIDLCVRTDCTSDSESTNSNCVNVCAPTSSAVQPMLRTILQPGQSSVDVDAPSSLSSYMSKMNDVVQLSRKQAHVVRARVASWLKEAVDFALDKPVFVTLPAEVQLVLLRRAWPRLLLLSMAEHGCTFAVSSCQRNSSSSTSAAAPPKVKGGLQPTRAFAESLLRVIELAHSLGLDETAFNLLRLAVILKGDNEAEVHLNQVHSEILMYFYSHLKGIDRIDYFSDVVQLLVVLGDIDKNMIENLLCGQLPNSSVDRFLDERFAQR